MKGHLDDKVEEAFKDKKQKEFVYKINDFQATFYGLTGELIRTGIPVYYVYNILASDLKLEDKIFFSSVGFTTMYVIGTLLSIGANKINNYVIERIKK